MEDVLMWKCAKCHAEVEGGNICWKCGISKDEVDNPGFQRMPTALPEDRQHKQKQHPKRIGCVIFMAGLLLSCLSVCVWYANGVATAMHNGNEIGESIGVVGGLVGIVLAVLGCFVALLDISRSS
jgi:hypothetical protein